MNTPQGLCAHQRGRPIAKVQVTCFRHMFCVTASPFSGSTLSPSTHFTTIKVINCKKVMSAVTVSPQPLQVWLHVTMLHVKFLCIYGI